MQIMLLWKNLERYQTDIYVKGNSCMEIIHNKPMQQLKYSILKTHNSAAFKCLSKKYQLHFFLKKLKTLRPLFMDGVQLPQGQSCFKEAVYFLPLSSQKFVVLILSTLEGRKAELTLKPPSGFEHEIPGTPLTTKSFL